MYLKDTHIMYEGSRKAGIDPRDQPLLQNLND